MTSKALFEGLLFDEWDQLVGVTVVGDEALYVVNDAGFKRHISAEEVDRQVLAVMGQSVEENRDAIAEQTAKMLGQDDIFSRAMIEQQLEHIDDQFENLLKSGIPEEGRAYMGMIGFRVVINMHGEVLRVVQPSAPDDGGGDGDD